MDYLWLYTLWAFGAYLLGSLSLGDLVARAAGVNIRALGTGNPGAANIYREIGPVYGAAVAVLDIAKGAVVIVPLYLLGVSPWLRLLATATLMGGHFFPILWRFHGGTGMATAMGATLGLLPTGGIIAAPAAMAVLFITPGGGYAGAAFFLVATVAGGLLHRDAIAALAVLLTGVAIFIRSWPQYRPR